MVNLLDVEYLM